MIRLVLLLCTLAWPATRTHQELIDLVGRKGDITHLYDLYKRADWVTPAEYGGLSQALTAIGSSPRTLLIADTIAITAATTIPSNITLFALQEGLFTVEDGDTLRVNGPFRAGRFRTFSLTGTGAVIFGYESEVMPEWFGAVGANTTTALTVDCAPALRASVASLLQHGGTISLLDRAYRFDSRIEINTSATSSHIRIRGAGDWRSTLEYYGSQTPALRLGDSAVLNSGLVSLESVHIAGGNSTGEVNGVEIYNGPRYTYWHQVRIRGFPRGLGLKGREIWSTDWGKIHVDQCYRGVDFGANAFSFKGLHVEFSGPWSSYSHSTIALTDPCVRLGGNGLDVVTLETEGNLSINVLEIQNQVRVLGWYIEGNTAHATGHEATLKGRGPVLIGQGYTGIYPTAPNPRYLIGLDSSVDAFVRFTYLPNSAPDQTNTSYGVDFESSKGANVHVDYQSYENLAQETAWNQTFKGNRNHFTYNGRRYAAGMPAEALGRLLLENYNAIPVEIGLMQQPESSLLAVGFTASNLGADAILKKFPSPLGSGRVQKVERSAASPAGLYYRFSSGTLSNTAKYFISSYIHRASASGTAHLRVLNGASDHLWTPRINDWVGWQQVSNLRVLENAGSSNIDIWPCYISSAAIHYTAGLVVINLTQFDSDYGTSIASLPVSDLEKILDLRLLSHRFREYTRNAAPADGSYAVGDIVWNYPSTAGGYAGWACTAAGSPGTWKQFGAVLP